MVNQYCAHSFARNWQLPILNQQKGENDSRNDQTPRQNVADFWGSNPQPPDHQLDAQPAEQTVIYESTKTVIYERIKQSYMKVLNSHIWKYQTIICECTKYMWKYQTVICESTKQSYMIVPNSHIWKYQTVIFESNKQSYMTCTFGNKNTAIFWHLPKISYHIPKISFHISERQFLTHLCRGLFYLNSLDQPSSGASDLGLHHLPMSILWDIRHKWVNKTSKQVS